MRILLLSVLLITLLSGVCMGQVNLTALKVELLGDPIGYGYAAMIDAPTYNNFDTVAVRDALNKIRLGDDGKPSITVRNPSISTRELLESAIDKADFKSNPTAIETALFQSLMALGDLSLVNADGSDTYVFANLKSFFAAGTGTRTRLTAMANRKGSRAEQLFGPGTVVTLQDVIDAVRLP